MQLNFAQSATSLLLVAAVGICGCSDPSVAGRPTPVPVAGRIFFNQQPCVDAKVAFVPQDHQYAAAGQTDENGCFNLQTFAPRDGAVPGAYKIMVTKFEVLDLPNGGFKETFFLPQRYRDPEKSGLTAVVSTEGEEDLKFDLVD